MQTAHQYFESMCSGWVLDNLREYHNSVVPTTAITSTGKKNIERILTLALGKQVTIVKKGEGYIAWC